MSKKKKETNNPDDYSTTGSLLDTPDTRIDDTGNRSINQAIENWLSSVYDFRYNIIKQKPEFRIKGTTAQFKPIDKYKLLSIKRELDANGYKISKDGLLDILCSSYSVAVNPIKDYFKNIFPWDQETDHIQELANTVKCVKSEKWHTYLKKWLVAVVANVFIDERCANHTMLVLTGGQGKFKTTWIENLCPKELISYLYTGKLNLESKDCLTLIAEYFLINIDDQLKQLHKKDENELKNLITINSVKYRRPYDPIITEYPHLGSFIGSINGNEFLNDPTGSRRFLPFEVSSIDIKEAQKINMELVWSQAYHLFLAKFRYWFNDEEIEELNKRNSEFAIISHEEEMLNHYFANKAPNGYNSLKFLPTSIILSKLEIHGRAKYSSKKLGEALNKLGYKKTQKVVEGKITWGWLIYEKQTSEIEAQEQLKEELL